VHPQVRHPSELVAAVGGVLAVLVGLSLAVVVMARGVGFNRLNLITILGAVTAGVMAWARPRRAGVLLLAAALLLIAALPALIGGLGLFLIPSIALVLTAMLGVHGTRREHLGVL
jgi:hypothetical protein